MLLTEGVKDNVDLIQHVHYLHGCDVNADLVELYHITKQDGDIWKYLAKSKTETETETKKRKYLEVSLYIETLLTIHSLKCVCTVSCKKAIYLRISM